MTALMMSSQHSPERRASGGQAAKKGSLILSILSLISGAALIVYAVVSYRSVAESSYTQSHGVRETVTVINDQVTKGKDSTWSEVAVRLSAPVGGRNTSTVNIGGATSYAPGASITALVDPQDPSYAELPGRPYNTFSSWILWPLLGGFFVLGSLYFTIVALRRRVLARQHPFAI